MTDKSIFLVKGEKLECFLGTCVCLSVLFCVSVNGVA